MAFKYDYITDLRPGENQYDGVYDLDEETIVKARYIKSKTTPGNPFIEALPVPWTMKEIVQNYTHPISIPTTDELSEMDEYEKEDNVDILMDSFRVQLPFHAIIEKQFHRSLIRSYNKRRTIEDKSINVKLNVKDKEVITHNKLDVKHMSEPVSGFTLLGSGGCGKSTGINIMLSHYPQTIIHAEDTWQRTYQIVYLLVQCTANSNFSKLYENIGEAIDKALNNFNPIYERQFSKGRLAEKYNLLKDLVKKFHIGCIIFDEIELMDTKSYKESSLQALLTLTNETGVAISVVGTMDAYKNLFFNARTARRMGVSIIASKYCIDRKRFGLIANILTSYQWGDNPVEYTEDMIDALFESSHGVISDLVEIYKLIQKDRVRLIPGPDDTAKDIKRKREKSINVTPAYIKKKASDYYEILQQARTIDVDPSTDDNIKTMTKEIVRLNSASEMSDIAQMEKRYDEVMADSSYKKMVSLRENVKLGIRNMNLGYKDRTIDRAFGIIIKNNNLDIPVDKAIAETIAYIEEKKEGKKKISSNDIKKEVFDIKALQDALRRNNEE